MGRMEGIEPCSGVPPLGLNSALTSHDLQSGTVFSMATTETLTNHYFVNFGQVDFRALFIYKGDPQPSLHTLLQHEATSQYRLHRVVHRGWCVQATRTQFTHFKVCHYIHLAVGIHRAVQKNEQLNLKGVRWQV